MGIKKQELKALRTMFENYKQRHGTIADIAFSRLTTSKGCENAIFKVVYLNRGKGCDVWAMCH